MSTPRGFAALSPERMREVASQGGKAAHASGAAHRYTSAEARAAGQVGGRAHSREHLAELGRLGGKAKRGTTHRKPAPKYCFETVLTFKDCGQDFLRWTVRRRIVTECEPFQGWLWNGAELLSKPKVGERVRIRLPRDRTKVMTVSYWVVRIERGKVEIPAGEVWS